MGQGGHPDMVKVDLSQDGTSHVDGYVQSGVNICAYTETDSMH